MARIPNSLGLLNQAALWHLQVCRKLLDKLGYAAAAANVSAAIDAMRDEIVTDDELDDATIAEQDRIDRVIEMFTRYKRKEDEEN